MNVKQQVAQQFSRAATEYDAKAQVQERIADDAVQALMRLLAQQSKPAENALDLGCGTGRVTQSLRPFARQITGVDIAPGMIEYAQQQYPSGQQQWLVADAEALPLAGQSVDLIFSCMALQWCSDFSQLFTELKRVCKPGATLLLAIMAKDSFSELRSSWQAIHQAPHVNRFAEPEQLWQWAQNAGFTGRYWQREYLTQHTNIRALLHTVKDVGASVVTRQRVQPMLTRGQLQQIQEYYLAHHAQQGLLNLTYNVCFLELRV